MSEWRAINGCTGISASWCPNCGDCTCPYDPVAGYYMGRDDASCPLHAQTSNHGEQEYLSILADAETGEPLRMTPATTPEAR